MSTPELLTQLRQQVDERLAELAPLVSEYETLARVRESLADTAAATPASAAAPAAPAPAATPARRRGPGRPPANGSSPARRSRRPGARGSKKPAKSMPREERIDLIAGMLREEPDLTREEVAARLGMSAGYMKDLIAKARKRNREATAS